MSRRPRNLGPEGPRGCQTLISRLAAALRECSDLLEQHDPGAACSERSVADGRAAVIRARALLAEWEEKKQRWRQAPEQAP
jgi:hypothetical protein